MEELVRVTVDVWVAVLEGVRDGEVVAVGEGVEVCDGV